MNIWTSEVGFGVANTIIENNDAYLTDAYRTNCSGAQQDNGPCSAAENGLIATKTGGTSSGPYRIIHNRVWGMRPCDTKVACDGGGTDGGAIGVGNGASSKIDHVLVQNNIIMDAEAGIWSYVDVGSLNSHSYVGNIIYNMAAYGSGIPSKEAGIWLAGVTPSANQVYLNTFIEMPTLPWLDLSGTTGSDLRCNVAIDTGKSQFIDGSGTQTDSQAYYGVSDSGEADKIVKPFILKTAYTGCTSLGCTATENTTGLSVGDIVRTSSTPVTACTSNNKHCYLYKVTAVGTSGTIQAIRGPYTFRRKLRTVPGGELAIIPYASVHASAPEANRCPANYASRTGIGAGGY